MVVTPPVTQIYPLSQFFVASGIGSTRFCANSKNLGALAKRAVFAWLKRLALAAGEARKLLKLRSRQLQHMSMSTKYQRAPYRHLAIQLQTAVLL
jgi:hypothetical protein